MLQRRLLALPLLLAGLALPSAAQGVGTRIPEIRLEGFSGTAAKSFDDFYGRAVLLEFFAYWCVPCASSVPHLNELQQKLQGKGLSIVGVTNEPSSLTEPWIAKHGAQYAYSYDKGGKLQSYFGISGIPHAVLVDATGTVVWTGHPGTLNESTIEEHLGGTLSKPVFEWPNASKGVAKSLVKGDFAGALAGAKALSEANGGPEVLAQVNGLIDARVAQVESWKKAGNFLDVLESGSGLAKGLGNHEHAAKVAALVAQVEAEKNAKSVVEAQKRVRKLRAKDPSKRKEIEAQMEDLEKIRSEMRGTYAAEEAAAYLDQLRAR